ncbi:hypothetical protein ECANGB1_928 [Enterospora canceri]|uniref:Brl1/Brr6 domain-containing protein n=1 Tax=Enterospora canceri TaxID=1081671 RepID=A0A1Y1S767_9MICR|nr:hypothetical protein ECANGB1_928 [Enterospora canceri]
MAEVKFNWKKRGKSEEKSEFLTNKQRPLPLPAPDEAVERDNISNTVEMSEITSNSKPKKFTAMTKISSKMQKYCTAPVKYTYGAIKRTQNMLSQPMLLIGYIHVLLNLFITASFIYIIGFLIYFLKIDVLYRINEKREIMRGVIQNAKEKYQINRCDPSTRVPALQKQCGEWDNIIRNGFSALNYTKIVVELLAGAIDGFVSKITYKTLVTIGFMMVFYLKYRR